MVIQKLKKEQNEWKILIERIQFMIFFYYQQEQEGNFLFELI
jgi:hypothetical protein